MRIKILLLAFTLIAFKQTCKGQQLFYGGFIGGSGINYKAGSLVFTGINTTLTTFNIINFNKKKSKSNAGFAVLTGLAQIIYCGIYSDKTRDNGYNVLNYSVGTVTTIIGGIRLFKKEKTQEGLTFYPYSYPTTKGFIVGLKLTRNLN